jgi:hypothetical protein
MNRANLDDIQQFKGGTVHFTFQDIAYQGFVNEIEYVPMGPGCINFKLLSLQPVTEGPAVPDLPLDFQLSLFMAEVENRPRELIVRQLIPQEGFVGSFSFHLP